MPPRKTAERRASSGLGRARHNEAGGLGAPRLPGAGPAPLDAAQGAHRARRRGGAARRDHRPGQAIWAVWLPAGRGPVAGGGGGGGQQRRGGGLGGGGGEGGGGPAHKGGAVGRWW